MSEVNINYKGSKIAGMDASGTKTLLTEGKYCEGNISVEYNKPAAPTPSLQSKTYTVDSAGTATVTADSGYDGLSSVSVSVPAAEIGEPYFTGTFATEGNQRIWVAEGGINVDEAGWINNAPIVCVDTDYNAVPANTTITPSTSAQTIGGANYMMEGAVTVNAIPSQYIVPSGTKSITQNGTGIDVTSYASVDVNVSGGGTSTVTVDSVYPQSSMTSSSLTFSGLDAEPTSFIVYVDDNITPSSTASVAAIVYDGTSLHGQTITNTSNAQVTYDGSSFTKSYSNGTLTITSTGASFVQVEYMLVYTYGGAVDTSDVQVGSGATSITFTGLEDEPAYWSLIFKSNFGTSSGYQRVVCVAKHSSLGVWGISMDSSTHNGSYWTQSYSNGSLTITSSGTNSGGYFHQPGYYQLTYAYDSTGNYQSKTVTPTTSQQVVQADSGYDALKKVTVNAIPNTYVQPTSTVGSTTYRASTSSQTIASGTYHSAAATIAAVSQTNLSAENIKSGTTISISNGSSNIWSVTGSYTGGGSGSSKNVQVSQSTTRTSAGSLTKVNGDLTVSKTGTYDVYWTAVRSATSSQYTWGSQLYVGSSGYGTENTSGWSNHVQNNHLSNVSLTADQKIAVYTRGRTGSYYTYAPMLVIVEA